MKITGGSVVAVVDQITEEISHFIGAFHLSLEEARLREAYQDFSHYTTSHGISSLLVEQTPFAAPYDLLGYDPSLYYRPVAPGFPSAATSDLPNGAAVVVDGLSLRLPRVEGVDPEFTAIQGANGRPTLPSIEPPGSVASYVFQHIHLSDNDVFSVGNHGLPLSHSSMSVWQDVIDAAQPLLSFSPLSAIEAPGSAIEMIELVKSVSETLENAASSDMAPHVVAQGQTLAGTYVNGVLAEETPKLEDYHSFEEDGDELDGNAGFAGGDLAPATVTVSLGANTIVNDAVLNTLWTAGKVTAVVGDHTEVNVIIQVNAIWDEDEIGSELAGWSQGGQDHPNDLFNIANFTRDGGTSGTAPAHYPADLYPAYATVTNITGDLMIFNWIEQMIFMSDSDMGIVSASGGYTTIIGGENTAINHTSIFEFGFEYDLIIIGGSVYDANIIQQINILFDNDTAIGADGFHTSGSGSFASSGNLLWNQASIHLVGAADRFSGLSDDYREAATSHASGTTTFSDAIMHDPAFAGLPALRVLHIHGDLIKLQYIKQTTIVGDNDQITLAMDMIKPNAGADWAVATGGNTLINNAAIHDLDSFGKTYVGGQQYSQETLIQANFISSKPEIYGQDASVLASEAVLFLDDSMLGPDPGPAEGVYVSTDATASQDDGLQTLLA
jgi:hypothetical protein